MNKYLPTYVFNSINDIDFNTLYEQGKKVILFDLDNTIATYNQLDPTKSHLEFNKMLHNIGFNIHIISNNKGPRIKRFVENFVVDGYLTNAKKPFSKNTSLYLEKNNIKKEEVVFIGDQTLTDISCANNLCIDSILVKSIDRKTEKWYTKINRIREKCIIKRLSKKNIGNAKEVLEIITKRGKNNE